MCFCAHFGLDFRPEAKIQLTHVSCCPKPQTEGLCDSDVKISRLSQIYVGFFKTTTSQWRSLPPRPEQTFREPDDTRLKGFLCWGVTVSSTQRRNQGPLKNRLALRLSCLTLKQWSLKLRRSKIAFFDMREMSLTLQSQGRIWSPGTVLSSRRGFLWGRTNTCSDKCCSVSCSWKQSDIFGDSNSRNLL